MVKPSVLLPAPLQNIAKPQPPSVLICCDCCSLIIESNKVKSFLSCLVCCLSPWLWLVPGPTGSEGVLCHSRNDKDRRRKRRCPAESRQPCNRNDGSKLVRSQIHFPVNTGRFYHGCLSVGWWNKHDILNEVLLTNGICVITICLMGWHIHENGPQK